MGNAVVKKNDLPVGLPANDTELIRANLSQLRKRSRAVAQHYVKRARLLDVPESPWNHQAIQRAFLDVWLKMLANPQVMQKATWAYLASLTKLGSQVYDQWRNPNHALTPVIEPAKDDKRFKDENWTINPFFSYIKQSYLLWDRWLNSMVEELEGVDKKIAHQVSFFTKQFTHSLSPNNFFHLNPQVMKETMASGGMNILQGLNNFLHDLEAGEGILKISMVEKEAFRLGENIATTPGQVVYQNELMQLIQYESTTPTVYRTPVLLVPPCINKYYIYDLKADNSFIKWMVDQGFTVFVISWVNPDATLAHKTFEDYALEGVGQALKVITHITQELNVHAVGFCIGGNMLALYSAYAAQVPEEESYLKSLTFLATPFDFKSVGDLQVFINEDQLDEMERHMQEKGYFDGKILAKTFNFLRANDLIWSFVINNYLMGKDPLAFDILHWNGDTTRLPSAMYNYYLKNLFLKNLLIVPGALKVKDKPIDLRKITVPTYILNTHRDHIIPWECGYRGAQVLGDKALFVLGGSGHVAGIFNHPRAQKYSYWIGKSVASSADKWLANATEYAGSWWTHWKEWAQHQSGDAIPARSIGSNLYPPLEAAPGSYVKAMND